LLLKRQAPQVYKLYRKANAKLYDLWGNKQNNNEEKWREGFRLLFADKDNLERFRQGFSQMLQIQCNAVADMALEIELRQNQDELTEENLCYQLENYLRQSEWRKADEETAWLFYLVMIKQNFHDWYELCQKFPSEILNLIDQLWLMYSQEYFGISTQKKIWDTVQGSPDGDLVKWWNFGRELKWNSGEEWNHQGKWLQIDNLSFSLNTAQMGSLPALYTTKNCCPTSDKFYQRLQSSGWEHLCAGQWEVGGLSSIFSRVNV
jgi:hypothetical protein